MRLGIKGKQVLGVTSIVVVVVVVLSVLNLARLASVSLDESRARAELLANAIYHRAQQVVVGGADPLAALRADPGLRSILESSLYSKNVMYAALVDVQGVAVAHADPSLEGQPLLPVGDLVKLLERPPLSQLRAIYSSQGQNLEFRGPLLLGNTEIGSTRIGVSTLLIRQDLDASLGPALVIAGTALGISVLVATLLAQWLLRPIHVIRSGLTRLGRGEFGVQLDLSQHDEFGELGSSFNAVSEQLSADRSQMAGQMANLESAVEHLEDAVAIVNARGELLFANPAMRALLPGASSGVPLTSVESRAPGATTPRSVKVRCRATGASRLLMEGARLVIPPPAPQAGRALAGGRQRRDPEVVLKVFPARLAGAPLERRRDRRVERFGDRLLQRQGERELAAGRQRDRLRIQDRPQDRAGHQADDRHAGRRAVEVDRAVRQIGRVVEIRDRRAGDRGARRPPPRRAPPPAGGSGAPCRPAR
jgi:PAS domain-containing protein